MRSYNFDLYEVPYVLLYEVYGMNASTVAEDILNLPFENLDSSKELFCKIVVYEKSFAEVKSVDFTFRHSILVEDLATILKKSLGTCLQAYINYRIQQTSYPGPADFQRFVFLVHELWYYNTSGEKVKYTPTGTYKADLPEPEDDTPYLPI